MEIVTIIHEDAPTEEKPWEHIPLHRPAPRLQPVNYTQTEALPPSVVLGWDLDEDDEAN